MSVRGLGMDILEIARIEKPFANPRFRARVYTEAELAYIERKGQSGPESAAVFFCVKEAVMKALGVGMSVSFNEIEVGHDERGAPIVLLHGETARLHASMGGGRVLVSLTHSKDYAAATVIFDD